MMKFFTVLVLALMATAVTADTCKCHKSWVGLVMDTSSSVSVDELKQMRNAVGEITKLMPTSVFAVTESFAKNPNTMMSYRDQWLGKPVKEGVIVADKDLAKPAFSYGSRLVLPQKPHATATDLFTGIRTITQRLKAIKQSNKLMIVLFDGAHNVYTQPTLDATLKTSTTTHLQNLVKTAQAQGVRVFFLGIQTDQFAANMNSRAAKCATAISTKSYEDVTKCLQKSVWSRTPAAVETWTKFKAGDAEATKKILAACKTVREVFSDQAKQITWLRENLSESLQYQTAENWDQLLAAAKKLARQVCASLGSSIHFDSGKSVAPCTNAFYPCQTEVASTLKELACCRDKPIFIGAHTSTAGSASSNMILGKKRAQHVAQLLRAGDGEVQAFTQDIYISSFGENALASTKDSGNEATLEAASNRRAVAYCGEPPKSSGKWDQSAATKIPAVVAPPSPSAPSTAPIPNGNGNGVTPAPAPIPNQGNGVNPTF